ncbi:MAG: hypothetical protein AAF682_00115 [Planctomycetota bacterium]
MDFGEVVPGWAKNLLISRVIRKRWFEEFSVEDTERQESSRARLTKDRKQRFLEELARTGIIAEAARLASPHAKGGAISTFYAERDRDPEFAAAWKDAAEHATGIVEREAFRRAVEGWDEPTRFGPVRKHSDRLLELLLKARSPQYREHRKYEVDAKTEVTEKKRLDLRSLSPHKLELLRQLVTPDDDSPCPDLGQCAAQDVTPTTTDPSGDRAPGSLTEDL